MGKCDFMTATRPLGQLIYCDDYYGAGVELCMGETMLAEVDGQPTIAFAADEEVTEAVYVIDGDIITLQNTVGSSETGQEVAQPSGLTIQVTTFTDGTRTATKVIK